MMLDLIKDNPEMWELFTKEEEYDESRLDTYERFSYSMSKHKNVLTPEVSTFLIQNGLEFNYPDEKKFAVCLTHDIDEVHFSIQRTGYEILRSIGKFKLKNAIQWLKSRKNNRFNPIWNLTEIMDLEKRYDAKSTFFILSLTEDDLDFNFHVDELSSELKNLIDNGWEVGLHGGHEAYHNLDKMVEEKKRLESVIGNEVIGYRNHFLKFKVPTTWKLLNKAGFKYDATFGYPDHVGFRNGMCHPYKPFNLKTGTSIDILEIPLNVMDATFDRRYMHSNPKKAWEIVRKIIDVVEANSGVLTLLWHNTYFLDTKLKLYEKILNYCSSKNAWMTSGKEIWEWWDGEEFPREGGLKKPK